MSLEGVGKYDDCQSVTRADNHCEHSSDITQCDNHTEDKYFTNKSHILYVVDNNLQS